MEVSFHSAAQGEIEEAVSFYRSKAPRLGAALRDEVAAALERIVEFPAVGFAVRPNFRRYVLRRFPYSLIYRADGEQIHVLAIMHHRRHPEYWHRRI